MTFKEKLVILRKTRGITQDEFASAVGVSRQAVYKWECGQSYPEVPKLLEIKLLFGISIDNLLDDTFEIALPEKKKRKRLSKQTIRRIEESVESGASNAAVTNTERVVEIARVAFEPEEAEDEEKREAYEPEELDTIEVAEEEEKTEEPVTVAAVEVFEEDAATDTVVEEPAIIEEPAPTVDAEPEKKKGFFGRLFGKK